MSIRRPNNQTLEVSCVSYRPISTKNKRCVYYCATGACDLPGKLMCAEWLRGQRGEESEGDKAPHGGNRAGQRQAGRVVVAQAEAAKMTHSSASNGVLESRPREAEALKGQAPSFQAFRHLRHEPA